MKNINMLYSNKEIIRKFCEKIFGIEADPININEHNLHIDLYLVNEGKVVGLFPTTLDEILEKYSNVVSLIGNPDKKESMLAIHLSELNKHDLEILGNSVYVVQSAISGIIKGVYFSEEKAKQYSDDEENMIIKTEIKDLKK